MCTRFGDTIACSIVEELLKLHYNRYDKFVSTSYNRYCFRLNQLLKTDKQVAVYLSDLLYNETINDIKNKVSDDFFLSILINMFKTRRRIFLEQLKNIK